MRKLYNLIRNKFSGKGYARYPIIKQVNNLIIKTLSKDYAVVHGMKMYLGKDDSLALSVIGDYDKEEMEYCKSKIKEGDVVLDIGAHVGYYTLNFSKLVGEKGKVYSFEPDKTNFEILKKNVEINNLKNVVVINKAVSDKVGEVKFYLSDSSSGNHSLFSMKDNNTEVVVDSITLDEYFKDKEDKIDFIKMDIEGAELQALNGMKDLIRKNQKLSFVLEYWQENMKGRETDHKEYIDFLLKRGFKISYLNECGEIVRLNDCFEFVSSSKRKTYPTNLFGERK